MTGFPNGYCCAVSILSILQHFCLAVNHRCPSAQLTIKTGRYRMQAIRWSALIECWRGQRRDSQTESAHTLNQTSVKVFSFSATRLQVQFQQPLLLANYLFGRVVYSIEKVKECINILECFFTWFGRFHPTKGKTTLFTLLFCTALAPPPSTLLLYFLQMGNCLVPLPLLLLPISSCYYWPVAAAAAFNHLAIKTHGRH